MDIMLITIAIVVAAFVYGVIVSVRKKEKHELTEEGAKIEKSRLLKRAGLLGVASILGPLLIVFILPTQWISSVLVVYIVPVSFLLTNQLLSLFTLRRKINDNLSSEPPVGSDP